MKILCILKYKCYGNSYEKHLENQSDADVKTYYIFSNRPESPFLSKKELIRDEIVSFGKLLYNIRLIYNARVYTQTSQFALMLIYKLFGWVLGKDCHLILHNFYIHGLGTNKLVKKILSFLLDSNKITLIVMTPNELNYYRCLSKKINLHFIPYCSDVLLDSMNNDEYSSEYDVFTGGYSNRDYELMKELAYKLPKQRFCFVVSCLNKLPIFPHNVKVFQDIPSGDFQNLLLKSRIIVIPLKEDVGSSGQMLCIQAMRGGKAIIYADVSSIQYYFDNNCGIPYKIRDIDSLYGAVTELMNNQERITELGINAKIKSLNYTLQNCTNEVDKIVLGRV